MLDKPGDPTASLVSIDVHTGRILAMVGGFDFKNQQFNIAVQGHRQPGSAFKTFVLVTALTQNIAPTTTYDSGPYTLTLPGADWKVKSTDEGMVALADATARSINGVYARLIMDVGPQKVADTARHLGIETNVDNNPAIALGGLKTGVSPLEMAVAYGTLASGGDRLSGSVVFDPEHPLFPVAIVKVTDAAGKVIDDNHVVRTQVIDPRIAYTATDVLKGVIDYGTARGRRHRATGGGQDGHHPGVPGCVVRRLHARRGHRGLGRLPRPAETDDRRPRHQGDRRQLPRADLGGLHAGRSRRGPRHRLRQTRRHRVGDGHVSIRSRGNLRPNGVRTDRNRHSSRAPSPPSTAPCTGPRRRPCRT